MCGCSTGDGRRPFRFSPVPIEKLGKMSDAFVSATFWTGIHTGMLGNCQRVPSAARSTTRDALWPIGARLSTFNVHRNVGVVVRTSQRLWHRD